MKALQEAGIFGTRPVAFFDFDWLGIHADAYSLTAQAVAILAIVVLYGRSRMAEKKRVDCLRAFAALIFAGKPAPTG